MKEILEDLTRSIDARGSLVITKDGIPIATHSHAEFHVERISALAQRVVHESKSACGALGASGFSRFVLTADHGRMIFVEMPVATLIVITSLDTSTEQVLLEIESAARKIERAVRIAV
jgi:predicted regulator of Ras-like GTPase activity (Roadblock/LC7/MglB family)